MISQAPPTGVSYFKRFRMEIDLQGELPPVPGLPPGCRWVAWEEGLAELHAQVKCQCFVEEIDAVVFSSLGNLEGCRRLMGEIQRNPGFRPEATWLIASEHDFCATVQGVRERTGAGAIQNLGVTAPYRGRGLGTALLLKALHGFRRVGAHRAHLEVTAQNDGAIRLYRRLGFRCRKTIYKAVSAFAALETPHQMPDWFL